VTYRAPSRTFVVGRIHEEVWNRLFDWSLEKLPNRIVEIFRHPGDGGRRELVNTKVLKVLSNPLNPAGRDTLQIRFDNSIHQCLLHPGIAPEDLRLEREFTELGFPENCLPVSGLEGSVIVAVPMRFPRIGAFVLGSSCLLEGLCEHHLVEEPGDEDLHAILLIGKIIFD